MGFIAMSEATSDSTGDTLTNIIIGLLIFLAIVGWITREHG